MSKSLGNFITLRDLLAEGHDPMAVRYLLLSAHYRTKLNFTKDGLTAAAETVEGLRNLVRDLKAVEASGKRGAVETEIEKTKRGFEQHMDNDLNLPQALGALFGFVNAVRKLLAEQMVGKEDAAAILNCLFALDDVLGLQLKSAGEDPWKTMKEARGELKELLEQREGFRKQKQWKEADAVRKKIGQIGFVIEDTNEGVRWRKD